MRSILLSAALLLFDACGPWTPGGPCKTTDDCGGILICYGGECMDRPEAGSSSSSGAGGAAAASHEIMTRPVGSVRVR